MTDNVDMSLDEIIKNNKNKNKAARGGRGGLLKGLARRSGIAGRGGRGGGQQQQSTRRKVSPVKSPNKPPQQLQTGAQLHISNLEFGVSNHDIKELFSTFGALKRATVHYDKSGRSLGTAEVIFANKDSAIRAMKKYNNIPLDGRAMNIKLVSNQVDSRIGPKPGGGIAKRNQSAPTRGRPSNRGRGKGPMPPRRGKPVKKTPTADELDADLEDYKMCVD